MIQLSHLHSCNVTELGFIYIRVKATSLLTCCIVSHLYIYTTATAAAIKIKENYHFRVRFRSNINEPLRWNWKGSLLQNVSRRYKLDRFVFIASFVSICDFVEKTASVLLSLLGFAVQCWTKLFHFPVHRTNTSHCILHKYFNWRPTTWLASRSRERGVSTWTSLNRSGSGVGSPYLVGGPNDWHTQDWKHYLPVN